MHSSPTRTGAMLAMLRWMKPFRPLQAQFPDHAFTALGEVDALEDYGRLAWAFGPPDNPQRVTGLDVAIVVDGRISALYTFLDTHSA
jgi:hypothetical protein